MYTNITQKPHAVDGISYIIKGRLEKYVLCIQVK